MARKGTEDWPEGPYSEHDWYLREWLEHFRMTNAAFGEKAGWSPATVSDLLNGTTNYYRRRVIEAANALRIAPFELMMRPADALALRQFRESGHQLFGEHSSSFRSGAPAPVPPTNTPPRNTPTRTDPPSPAPRRGRPRKK